MNKKLKFILSPVIIPTAFAKSAKKQQGDAGVAISILACFRFDYSVCMAFRAYSIIYSFVILSA